MQTVSPANPPERIRIRSLLMAGNPYDAFLLEEAGFRPPGEDEPAEVPSFDLVRTGEAALRLLADGEYDMLLTDFVLPDMTGPALAHQVRERFPGIPVAVLSSDTDIGGSSGRGKQILEPNLFIRYGAHNFLRTLVWLQEDEMNVPLLLPEGDALTILLVEDEPNFYSHFLLLLYERIHASALELIPTSRHPDSEWEVSDNRPLVLLRRNFEEACEVLYRYSSQIMAVISDMCFPVKGVLKSDAGLRLLYRTRAVNAHIPVAVHSRDQEHRKAAQEAGAKFLWKDSPHFLPELDQFMVDYCGFGPFVFRWPAGEVYGVARNLRELRDLIADVPEVVFEHHALHFDFSTWLAVHGFQRLVRNIRSRSIMEPTAREVVLEGIDRELKRQKAQGKG